MNDREIHWDLLRQPLLVFMLCVAVAAGLMYFSASRYDEVICD